MCESKHDRLLSTGMVLIYLAIFVALIAAFMPTGSGGQNGLFAVAGVLLFFAACWGIDSVFQ